MNRKWVMLILSILLILYFVILSMDHFELKQLTTLYRSFFSSPFSFLFLILVYMTAFLLRAFAWWIYLDKTVRYWNCLNGIWYSLLINHLLPIKVGDLARIGVISWKEKTVTWDESLHSVVMMRVLDMCILLLFSSIGILFYMHALIPTTFLIFMVTLVCFGLFGFWIYRRYRPKFLTKHIRMFCQAFGSSNRLFILSAIIMSWICEGYVLYTMARNSGVTLTFIKAVWVNSITVSGQVFQITPGGIATYEAVMVFTLGLIEIGREQAYYLALLSHTFKFLFSYVLGLLVVILVPIPFKKIWNWIRLKGE